MSKRSNSTIYTQIPHDIYWGVPISTNTSKKQKLENERNAVLVGSNQIYTIGNEIHFTAGIDKDTIQQLIRHITQIIHDHKKKYSIGEPKKLEIIYIVDSPGGGVTSILKFVDFINLTKKQHKFLTYTSIITGMAASAGTIMAIVADKRCMTKNAHAMIHELSSGNSGKYTELLSYTGFLKKLNRKLTNIYRNKTGMEKDKIDELLRAETWFTAKQYLENGFIDQIQ
jgi:ATP-dependent protease ClpP protease subunit